MRRGSARRLGSSSSISASRAGVLLIAALLMIAGCTNTRGGPIPYEVQTFGVPDQPPAARVNDYKIMPADHLKLSVFQNPDLSGEFEVGSNGEAAFPLIGTVPVVGLNVAQLRQELVRRLDKYLYNPAVTVSVTAAVKPTITVDGSVREPGMFPVTGPLTLIQAVTLARGLEQDANPRRVAVFRQIGGQRTAAAFDLQSIRRGEAADPQVFSGDIIVVDGSKVAKAQRDLLQALPIIGLFRPF